MPERLTSIITTPSEKVQGEGSFVKFKTLLWGEAQTVAGWDVGDNEKASKTIRDFLAGRILDWNWVGDDGEPLPLPPAEGWLDRLTKAEVAYLIGLTTTS